MLFPHKVTIFNFRERDDEVEYNSSVIEGVLFVKDENTARNKLGLANSDTITIYIPKKSKCDKTFIDGFEYEKLSDADINSYYTLRKNDFVSFGEVSLESKDINDLKNDTGNIYVITGIIDYMFGGLPNIVVSAR